MSSFGQMIDKKMDRARRLIDKVDDREALQALNALYDVLDLVFTEVGQPQVMTIDSSALLAAKEKKDSEKSSPAMVQTKPSQSAGEKIAGGGGLYL